MLGLAFLVAAFLFTKISTIVVESYVFSSLPSLSLQLTDPRSSNVRGCRKRVLESVAGRGLVIKPENFLLSASHSHSGPGALSPNQLWAVAPAMDLIVPGRSSMSMHVFIYELAYS